MDFDLIASWKRKTYNDKAIGFDAKITLNGASVVLPDKVRENTICTEALMRWEKRMRNNQNGTENNSYITKQFDLPKQIEIPSGFEKESRKDITVFHVEKMVNDYSKDLQVVVNEKTKILTEEMLDEFISKYVNILEEELVNMQKGDSQLNVLDYKWINKK